MTEIPIRCRKSRSQVHSFPISQLVELCILTSTSRTVTPPIFAVFGNMFEGFVDEVLLAEWKLSWFEVSKRDVENENYPKCGQQNYARRDFTKKRLVSKYRTFLSRLPDPICRISYGLCYVYPNHPSRKQ